MEKPGGSLNNMEHVEDDDVVLLPDMRQRVESPDHLQNANNEIEEVPEELVDILEDTGGDPEVNGIVQPNSNGDLHPPANPHLKNYTLKCVIVASLASAVLGFYVKVTSGMVVHIKKGMKITNFHLEAMTGILKGLQLLGSVMAGWTADWKGRCSTVMLAGSILFVGFLLSSFHSSAFFLIGHSIANIGVGWVLMIVPIYIAELSPAFFRGSLTSFPEIFVNIGSILGYLFNFGFFKLSFNFGWRVMLGVGVICLVLLIIKVLQMPESPRWLIMKGRLHDAKCVLTRTYDSNEAKLRLADIKRAVGIPEECNEDVVDVPTQSIWECVWRDLLLHQTSSVRHILICICIINIFQRAFSIDTVLLIFEKADILSSNNILLMTSAVDLLKTILIPIAAYLLDRVGRRPLLLFSIHGMMVTLTILGMGLINIDPSDMELTRAKIICIASVLIHVVFFSVGIGLITSVYSSEVFPLRLRAQGFTIGVVVNQVVSIILLMVFSPLYKAITLGGVAFLFAVIAMSACVFVYVMMPETRRRTLEEMGLFFGDYTRWRSTASRLRCK